MFHLPFPCSCPLPFFYGLLGPSCFILCFRFVIGLAHSQLICLDNSIVTLGSWIQSHSFKDLCSGLVTYIKMCNSIIYSHLENIRPHKYCFWYSLPNHAIEGLILIPCLSIQALSQQCFIAMFHWLGWHKQVLEP